MMNSFSFHFTPSQSSLLTPSSFSPFNPSSPSPSPSPHRRRRLPPLRLRMDSASFPSISSSSSSFSLLTELDTRRRQMDKVLVIMGATGCGKSKLSVDLSTTYGFQTEIINSDKMQVYWGLDITTNKISIKEQRGVPHHLLGDFDPTAGDFTAPQFRLAAGEAISDISSRGKLPVVVGGSNSFIHALLVDRYTPGSDVFNGSENRIPAQLRYDCCFVWLDVSFSVLCDYLCRRVDEMLESGMLEELAEFYSEESWSSKTGLLKAIGVPEMERYFQVVMKNGNKFHLGNNNKKKWGRDGVRRSVYEEAVRAIKENTCRLAERQMGKILRLKNDGWDLQRVDATEAFKELMRAEEEEEEEEVMTSVSCAGGGGQKRKKRRRRWVEVWEREVVEPSVKIVKRFLEE
ncbi:Adenylate isopentenyltransferase [Linum perenne]